MPAPHLTLVEALALVLRGAFVPSAKYAALQRRGLIRVKGHGPNARPVPSEAGRALLAARAGAGG